MFTNENLHNLILCARKELNLRQSQIARDIGVSQATYSRIEKGNISLTVYQWSRLCQVLNLPIEAVNYKYLDRKTIAEIRSSATENGFLLPSRYVRSRCLKVRFLLPLFYYLVQIHTREELFETFHKMNLNPSFFYNLDNQVNLKMLEDILLNFGLDKKMESITEQIIKKFKLPESHGNLFHIYKNSKNSLDLISCALDNLNKYQQLFLYTIIKSSKNELVFNIEKNCLLIKSMASCNEPTVYFLDKYKTSILENLPLKQEYLNREKIILNIIEKNDKKSTLVARVS